MPMAGYGKNEYGESLWRIVFTDSVRRLIGGRHADGTLGYKWLRVYIGKEAKGRWVLERWRSAFELTQCTPEIYDAKFKDEWGLFRNGPYPHRGDYEEVWVFTGSPAEVNIARIIDWSNHQQGMGFAERHRLRKEASEYQEKADSDRNIDKMIDIQPNPCGSMMIKKRRQIKLSPAKKFGNRLPSDLGFGQTAAV
jgi:hypothetical protein